MSMTHFDKGQEERDAAIAAELEGLPDCLANNQDLKVGIRALIIKEAKLCLSLEAGNRFGSDFPALNEMGLEDYLHELAVGVVAS